MTAARTRRIISYKAKPEEDASFFGTCDWGWCDAPAVEWRWDPSAKYGLWLPVCAQHRQGSA